MAGREGGGGVVGEPYINSEEQQITAYCRANTDGTRQINIGLKANIKLIVTHCIISLSNCDLDTELI